MATVWRFRGDRVHVTDPDGNDDPLTIAFPCSGGPTNPSQMRLTPGPPGVANPAPLAGGSVTVGANVQACPVQAGPANSAIAPPILTVVLQSATGSTQANGYLEVTLAANDSAVIHSAGLPFTDAEIDAASTVEVFDGNPDAPPTRP